MKTLPQPWTAVMEATDSTGWIYDHLHDAQIHGSLENIPFMNYSSISRSREVAPTDARSHTPSREMATHSGVPGSPR